jgi:hypothetical protein
MLIYSFASFTIVAQGLSRFPDLLYSQCQTTTNHRKTTASAIISASEKPAEKFFVSFAVILTKNLHVQTLLYVNLSL